MVNFDSGLPGTAAEAWAADGRLSTVPPLELGPTDRVIVIAAHPDDETLGAGGLISECSLQGIPVQIVIVTDGAASHPTSTESERAVLTATRAREARAALQILAPESAVTFLGFPDGGVRERTDQLYDALATLVENAPGTTLLVAPWRGDGHRDHRVVGEACASLAAARDIRLIEYPIWMWHWSTPDNAVTPWSAFDSLALRPQSVAAKRRAIAEYSSQILAGSDAEGGGDPVLHPKFLRNFGRTTEVFVTRPVVATPPEPHSAGVPPFEPTVASPPSAASGWAVEAAPAPAATAAPEALQQNPTAMAANPGAAGSAEQATLGQAYFDATYSRRGDPWGFETRWYESRKRAMTLAALPSEKYESALEIGCSIGVLTEQLAARCASVLAVDISQQAVDRARTRLRDQAHVTVERADVGRRFPDRQFDLIVVSEVGYYFDADDLDTLLDRIEHALGPTGTLVLCHWRHPVDDYPLTGDEVHQAVRTRAGLNRLAAHVEEDFCLRSFPMTPVGGGADGTAVTAPAGIDAIAVVIPARNEEDLVVRALHAVVRATREVQARLGTGAPTVEIVLVADGCEDSTAELAREVAGVWVHVINASSVGAARAAGVDLALARLRDVGNVVYRRIWIATTDADSVVPPHWISDQLAIAAAGADVMVGTVRPDFADLSAAQIARWSATHTPGQPNGHVHGANLGVRADLYLAAGGFHAQPEHEDVDLVNRLTLQGAQIHATDSCEVLTSGRRDGRTPSGYAGFLHSTPPSAAVL